MTHFFIKVKNKYYVNYALKHQLCSLIILRQLRKDSFLAVQPKQLKENVHSNGVCASISAFRDIYPSVLHSNNWAYVCNIPGVQLNALNNIEQLQRQTAL